jgi:hypothetical protein
MPYFRYSSLLTLRYTASLLYLSQQLASLPESTDQYQMLQKTMAIQLLAVPDFDATAADTATSNEQVTTPAQRAKLQASASANKVGARTSLAIFLDHV